MFAQCQLALIFQVYAQKENLDEIISFLTDENLEQTENS